MGDAGEILTRVWEQLTGRLTGPMTFRFALQPCIAAALAVRAGLADARNGRPPYLWHTLTEPSARRALAREAWRDVGRIFVLACVLDAAYQWLVFHWFYPVQAAIVACL